MSNALPFTILIVSLLTLSACEPEEVGPPSTMRIDRIVVSDYPLTNGGVPWDDPFIGSASPPDVTWTISGAEAFQSESYAPDADGPSIEFSNGLPLFLSKLENTYTFRIWDKDDLDGSDFASEDDQMAAVSFVPWESENDDNLDVITLNANGCIISLEVSFLRE